MSSSSDSHGTHDMNAPRAEEGVGLRECPFCGAAMQLRYALWPSEGDTDAVIHNVPGGTDCPIEGAFTIGTADGGVSVAEAWNRRPAPSPEAGDLVERLTKFLAENEPQMFRGEARLVRDTIARLQSADAAIAKMREALGWYERQVTDCRKLGGDGDKARSALDKDGGKVARQALSETAND